MIKLPRNSEPVIDVLATTGHRPYALPASQWRMCQRWNDLLFAHWPIPVDAIQPLVPAGLEVETFDGAAWVGVVPFWMDNVRTRLVGDKGFSIPTTGTFPELNLRTYVRSRTSGLHGVYFFSLDAASLLAVLGARMLFHLPYHWAWMERTTTYIGPGPFHYRSESTVDYESRRLTRKSARFAAGYRSLDAAKKPTPSKPGTLEHFLTERYCLFTAQGGKISVGHIHHLPWPLEPAEADIRLNELPAAHGIKLPKRPPVLHFVRELEVYIWPLQEDRP
jgi:uncharacterized protein